MTLVRPVEFHRYIGNMRGLSCMERTVGWEKWRAPLGTILAGLVFAVYFLPLPSLQRIGLTHSEEHDRESTSFTPPPNYCSVFCTNEENNRFKGNE